MESVRSSITKHSGIKIAEKLLAGKAFSFSEIFVFNICSINRVKVACVVDINFFFYGLILLLFDSTN